MLPTDFTRCQGLWRTAPSRPAEGPPAVRSVPLTSSKDLSGLMRTPPIGSADRRGSVSGKAFRYPAFRYDALMRTKVRGGHGVLEMGFRSGVSGSPVSQRPAIGMGEIASPAARRAGRG